VSTILQSASGKPKVVSVDLLKGALLKVDAANLDAVGTNHLPPSLPPPNEPASNSLVSSIFQTGSGKPKAIAKDLLIGAREKIGAVVPDPPLSSPILTDASQLPSVKTPLAPKNDMVCFFLPLFF